MEGIGSGEDGDCVSDCTDLLFHKKEKKCIDADLSLPAVY